MKRKLAAGGLIQASLGVALMFLGWGLDDVPGFLAHPARLGILLLVLLGIVTAVVLRLDVQPFRRGKRDVNRWGLPTLIATGLSLIWFLPYADRRGVLTFEDIAALRYTGLALYAAGAVLALLALRELGRQYSGYVTLQDHHRLVQTGIYGVIRHPIYLRALLVSVGIPLVFRSWLIVAMAPALAVFVAVRIRREEKLLAGHFGAEFEAYRKRTRRLIPYVY